MSDFDDRKAIGALAHFVGQALATLCVDDPGMVAALDRVIAHHDANAAGPSQSEVMNAVRLGAEARFSAIRTGAFRRNSHPEQRGPHQSPRSLPDEG
ncbi:hypothetical protein [Gluconobacter cerinus]|uniref:hypothetical protein n=1 Tax=Gluconobacter cerinus TaxID=38307 RepID=UPI001B8CC775|nr:hypothetical protein [Gluconobacter cerinus]MBS1067275.1 hypothetical protein [Gluconobacter cerinus]